jgi:hypothetical protein
MYLCKFWKFDRVKTKKKFLRVSFHMRYSLQIKKIFRFSKKKVWLVCQRHNALFFFLYATIPYAVYRHNRLRSIHWLYCLLSALILVCALLARISQWLSRNSCTQINNVFDTKLLKELNKVLKVRMFVSVVYVDCRIKKKNKDASH